MISWGNLVGVWLLWPTLIGCMLAVCIYCQRNRLVKLLLNYGSLGFGNYQRKLKIRLVLWCGALLSLWVAFLAPQWGQSVQQFPQKSRNIVVALDISKSMLAQDFKPNRLVFAKNKIKKLIHNLAGDRVGLILFAGEAFVMCPLTKDQDLLLTFLEDAQAQTISNGATNLTRAIEVAVKMVKQTDASATNLLTIFTDGEDFSHGIEEASQLAKSAGVHIFTLGVATLQGAPIPQFDLDGKQAGFIKDKQGAVVISRLNQTLLNAISTKCGGDYVMAAADCDTDLEKVADWVVRFERKQNGEKTLIMKEEKYYYFTAFALILLFLEWLL